MRFVRENKYFLFGTAMLLVAQTGWSNDLSLTEKKDLKPCSSYLSELNKFEKNHKKQLDLEDEKFEKFAPFFKKSIELRDAFYPQIKKHKVETHYGDYFSNKEKNTNEQIKIQSDILHRIEGSQELKNAFKSIQADIPEFNADSTLKFLEVDKGRCLSEYCEDRDPNILYQDRGAALAGTIFFNEGPKEIKLKDGSMYRVFLRGEFELRYPRYGADFGNVAFPRADISVLVHKKVMLPQDPSRPASPANPMVSRWVEVSPYQDIEMPDSMHRAAVEFSGGYVYHSAGANAKSNLTVTNRRVFARYCEDIIKRSKTGGNPPDEAKSSRKSKDVTDPASNAVKKATEPVRDSKSGR